MVEANPTNAPQHSNVGSEEMKSPQEQTFATPGQDLQNLEIGMNLSGNVQSANQVPLMTCIKMKGLPFSVKREDIINFFQGCNLREDTVKIGAIGGRLTGEACVLFATGEDCQQA